MGIVCARSSGSAGFQDIEGSEGSGLCPAYVVVYVQSYGLVGTVLGIGVEDEGPMLLSSNDKTVIVKATELPALEPCVCVTNFHAPVSLGQLTILNPSQCVFSIEMILPPTGLVLKFQ